MPPLAVTELPITVDGINEQRIGEILQAVSTGFGFTLTAQAGSHIAFHFHIQGGSVSENSNAHRVEVGNIEQSTIGSIGSSGNVTLFQSQVEKLNIDADEKKALREARQMLETLALHPKLKGDVAGDLDKVVEELKDPQRDEGRLKRILRNINEIAPPVAAALSMAASLHKLLI